MNPSLVNRLMLKALHEIFLEWGNLFTKHCKKIARHVLHEGPLSPPPPPFYSALSTTS